MKHLLPFAPSDTLAFSQGRFFLIPKCSESWTKLILTFQERTKPQGVQRHRPGLLENHPHEQCEPCDIETLSFLQSLNVTWIQVEYLTIHPDSKHAAKHPAEACGGMLRHAEAMSEMPGSVLSAKRPND
jgi:hypothetical protein